MDELGAYSIHFQHCCRLQGGKVMMWSRDKGRKRERKTCVNPYIHLINLPWTRKFAQLVRQLLACQTVRGAPQQLAHPEPQWLAIFLLLSSSTQCMGLLCIDLQITAYPSGWKLAQYQNNIPSLGDCCWNLEIVRWHCEGIIPNLMISTSHTVLLRSLSASQ